MLISNDASQQEAIIQAAVKQQAVGITNNLFFRVLLTSFRYTMGIKGLAKLLSDEAPDVS